MARILTVSDLHIPAEHPNALKFLIYLQNKYHTETTIFLGDLIDAHSFSGRWPANPDMPSAGDELKLAIKQLKPFIKAFPNAHLILGNHERRMWVKFRVCGAPDKILRRYHEILELPKGWMIHEKGFEYAGIWFWHGEGVSHENWRYAHHKLKMSCCFGHWHSKPGVSFSQTRKTSHHKSLLWSSNAGCLIDTAHPYFEYNASSIERPVIGTTVIVDDVPYFEPMPPKWL